LSFYKRKEIKDLLSYYRLTINQDDDSALLRIINYPTRGIGKSSIEKLIVVANDAGKSIAAVITDISEYNTGLNQGVIHKLTDFITTIKSFSAMLKKKDAFELAKEIAYSSGIMKDLKEDLQTLEGRNRLENIEELLNAIKEFTESKPQVLDIETPNSELRTLDIFMQDVALLTNADKDDKEDNNKVLMMTVHQAKGLEFPYVYVSGLEENLFPSMMSIQSREDIEEERRLFYVAVTRARQRVTLSYCQSRYRWGNITYCEPSRFIDEIDPQYLELPERKSIYSGHKSQKNNSKPPSFSEPAVLYNAQPPKNLKKLKDIGTNNDNDFVNSDTLRLEPGMEVEHQRFGIGKVISIEGKDANRKASVLFQDVGQKQLLLRFAKLKLINNG